MRKRILTSLSLIAILLFTLALVQPALADGGNVTLTVLDSNNNPLDGVELFYNDYGSHWVSLGTTSGGSPVMATLEDGTYNIKAVKNYSAQVASVTVSGTGAQTFQTALFMVNVTDSGGANFPGIAVAYNDYGSHYLDMGDTDVNGNAYIELFPGTYTFRATKNYSAVAGSTSSSINFQTQNFMVHVDDSSGAPFSGIAVDYNDYGSHYLSMGDTDVNGNASIELFPGTYTFKASKNYSAAAGATSSTINFQTAKFSVHVVDSSGANFEGIATSYNDYGSHWLSMGDTDVDGKTSIELFPGTYKFKANKNHTDVTGDLVNNTAGTEAIIDFQTANAIAYVKDCDGSPLAGIKVGFNDYGSHWLTVGTTGVDGIAAIELFPGVRTFKASVNYTSEVKDINLALTESAVEFNPTKVNWQYSGTIKYNDYGSHWKTMTSPFYMFPGTYSFKFDDIQNDIPIAGCSMDSKVVILRLTDHNGNPLSGGSARGGNGASYSTWHVAGSTDANGLLFDFPNSTATSMSYEMRYNNTTAHLTQDVTANPVFDFQTDLLTLRMETCGGTPLDGGNPRGGHGSTYGTWWFPGGQTGASVPGETNAEFFPGTYSFEMQYKATADQKLNFTFPDDGNILTWQTTNVTLNYSGQISYGGSSGDSAWFTKPSMELLPGTYMFHFRGAGRKQLTLNGCGYTENVNAIKLIDSSGNGIAGGTAKYYDSGWKTIGTTDASGVIFFDPNTTKTNLKFRMEYGGAKQEFYQDLGSNSVVVFQTVPVTVDLLNSSSAPLVGTAKYYASGWHTIGDTTASVELLPLNYKFRIEYGGAKLEKYQNVSGDSNVIFQTIPVSVDLIDSHGDPLVGTAKYYASGWHTIGDTTASVELLPLNYKFRIEYGGAKLEKYQNTNDDADVVFETVPITVALLDSNGGSLIGTAKYYASGWHTIGDTPATTELLPLNYKFRMEYGGAKLEKYQNIGSAPNVVFNTVKVTVSLETGAGDPLSGGVAKYYASGWKAVGTTNANGEATTELLPLNYKFRMEYGGASNEQYQNVGVDPNVLFTAQNAIPTVMLVDSNNVGIPGGVVKYYASGWKSFGVTDANGIVQKDDLLPGNYKFRMEYGGAAQEIYFDVTSEQQLVFQTELVTINLKDHTGTTGNLPNEGLVKYYASGWKTVGNTVDGVATVELLPLKYKFRMEYGGGAQEFYQNVGSNPIVDYQTKLVTVVLKDHTGVTGNLPDEGFAKYYASGWKSIGNTVDGVTNIELLPLKYKFRMEYGGGAQEFYQNVNDDPMVNFQTTLVTVTLKDCDDTGVPDGLAKYYASGWKTIGNTDATGEVKIELLPLKYKFRIQYGGASNEKYQTVSADPLVEFSATKFEYVSTETVKYYASGWKTLNGPTYLLPGRYKFKIGSEYQYFDISGCSLIGGAVSIQAVDSLGNPLAGVEVKAFKPNTGGFTMGTTDSSGRVTATLPWHGNGIVFTARYRKSSASAAVDVAQFLNPNPLHTFQTTPAVIEVKDCDGNPVEGTDVTYFISNSGGGTVGTTGPSGIVSTELFPGTYQFRARINKTTGYADVDIAAGTPVDHTFVPTIVEFHHSLGKVSMWQNNIGGTTFNGPTYIFPGSYTIDFYDGNTKLYSMPLTITEGMCGIEKSMLVLDLLNSYGGGLADGEFTYRFGWGDYTTIGTTDSSGRIFYALDGAPVKTKVKVTYNGAAVEKEQNVATNSHFVFQTVPVTAKLENSVGADISSGATFEYRYGWGAYTALTGTTELLPVKTKVKVSYAGAAVEKEQNAGSTPDFVFATVPISAQLLASDGITDLSPGATFEYRYGWGSYTPLTGPTELLPVKTKVKVSYAGTAVEKEQSVGSAPLFTFQTVPVSAQLLASDGTTDLSASATFEYRYGWGGYTPLTGTTELLPVKTKVKVSYAGTSVEKEQNVSATSVFTFQTGSVTSATCIQYRYGWGSYMSFTDPFELLAVSTKFSDADGPDISLTPTSGSTANIVCQ